MSDVRLQESLPGHLRAELIRLKGSAALWFSLIGLLVGGLSILLSGGARAAGFESAVFSWQVMYFTGMAAPLMMVLAAIQESRDRKADMAGLLWRGAHARNAQAARLFGAGLAACLFQVFSYGSIILVAGSPVQESLVAMAYSILGAWGYIALGALVAREMGMAGALFVGVLWQILGGIFAESQIWWLIPAAWPIRILLEPTGVNFNGTPIEPTNPVLDDPPLLGALLCLLFAVAMSALVIQTAQPYKTSGRTKRTQPSKRTQTSAAQHTAATQSFASLSTESTAGTHRRAQHPFPLGAVNLALRGSGIWILTALAAAIIIFASITYDPELVSQIMTFTLFPVGVGLLPVLSWRIYQTGHALLHVHNRAATHVYVFYHALVITVLVAILALCLVLRGMPLTDVAIRAILWLLVGIALALLALTLTVRFGPAAALGALIVWTIVGLTLGGDALSETFLWMVAVPSWPEIGIAPHRRVLALILAVILAAAASAAALHALRASRRSS